MKIWFKKMTDLNVENQLRASNEDMQTLPVITFIQHPSYRQEYTGTVNYNYNI